MHFKHFTRLFLLIGMIGTFSLTSWAQRGEIQIGSGTSTDYYLPSPSAFKYAISQQIYTADEIENAGGDDDLINQIAFYNASDNQYSRNFDIYMLNTTKTAFESSSDWFAVSQNDLFFSGEVTMTSNAWTTISFTTPFSYEGNNIAIIIDDNTGTANYNSMGYLCFTTSQTQSIYNNGDTNYNPMSVTGYGITRITKNQIRLIMEDSNTECPKPQNLSVSELSDISAKLMWNVGGSETAWNVQYKRTTDNSWSDAVTVTSPTHTLTELNPNTPYQARVQADCGSNWKKVSFTTECGPVNLPFEYGFEGAATGTSNPLPDCWNRINNASNSNYTGYPDVLSNYSWTTYSHNGSNCLRFNHNSSYMSYQIAVLPVINTTTYPMNGNQVVFWAKPSSGTDKKIQVGIMTDPVDANTFELIEEISLTSTSYDEYIVNFDSYQGQGHYIALKFAPTQSSATVYVDDIMVQTIPPCEKPRALAASEITAHSAKLSWSGGSGSWQIAYSTTSGFNPNNASQCDYETTTTNPFTLSGLEAETSYSFRVRTICENNDYSDWNNTVCSFTTSIACQKPTSLTVVTTSEDATLSWTPGDVNQNNWEVYYTTSPTAPTNTTQGISVNQTPSYTFTNLELETTYYAYVRSDCDSEGLSSWTEAVTIYLGYCQPAPYSVDKQGITNVTFGTGNEIVNNDQRPESKPYYGNYSSQIGAAPAGSEVNVAIKYETGYTYGTLIWVDWNNNFEFEDDEIVYTGMSTNANPTTLNASFTIAQTQSAGYYRMRIGGADSYFDSYVNGNHNANHDPCYNSSYAVFHDYTLHVTEAPSCPMPTHFEVDEQARTASFSWTAGGSETQWEFSCSETSGAPEQGSVISDNPHTVNNLQPNTQYYAYIRAICDTENGDYSDWMELSFTTAEACPAPTNLTYNGVGSNVATVSWTAGATGQNAWNLQYKKHSDTDWSDPIEVNDANSYQLTGLSAITSYDVQVQAVCGGEDGASEWLTRTNLFTTDCGTMVLPYSYGFEDNLQSGSYPMPKCWNRIAYSSSTNPNAKYPYVFEATSSQPYAHGENGNNSASGHSLYLWRNSSSSNETAILPEMDDSYDMSMIQISFWARLHNDATNQTLSIGVMNSTTYGYSEVATVNIESDHFTQYTVSLADYTGTGRYIAFKCGSGSDVKYYIDDITINYIPSCQIPTGLAATVNSATQTTLTWQPGGNETDWELEVTAENSGASQTIPVTDNPTYTLTTNRATTYSVIVRANCGDGDYSDWSNPISFTTDCGILPVDAQNPFIEDFNGETFPPTCWQKVNFGEMGETNGWLRTTTNNPLDNQGAVSSDFKNETWLFLPHLHIDGDATLSFDNLFGNGSVYAPSSIMVSTEAFEDLEIIKDAEFIISEHFTSIWAADANHLPDSKQNETVSLSNYNGQDVHIAFRYEGTYAIDQIIWYIDNVHVFVPVTQNVTLSQGWNWWSPTVETSLEELENGLGTNGVSIISKDDNVTYDNALGWIGELTIEPGKMYKIQVISDCSFTLNGVVADPSNHMVNLSNGYNWIGFFGTQSMGLESALSDLQPEDGDVIMDKDLSSTYYESLGWVGDIISLEPGKGYMYKSNANNSKSFHFPSSRQ